MKYLFTLLNICCVLIVYGQGTISIPSTVKSVTVYPQGARIERTASKFLSSGRQVLTFSGLPSELDPSSIGVSAGNAISVLSVSSQINHLQRVAKPKNVQILQDSLNQYEFDLKFNQNMINVYQEERKMILANQKIGWEKSPFIVEDLEDLSDFYRERLADIMLKEMQLQSKQERYTEAIKRLKAQLSEFNSKLNRATGEILVEVMVPSNANADFSLTYMVRNAGWIPAYNVNVTEVDRPLQVSYNAKVYQNTGIDWDGVTLTLTNANPNLSGTKPEIHPWKLYFMQPEMLSQYQKSGRSNTRLELAEPVTLAADDAYAGTDSYSIEYPANEAVTQFSIKTKHSIPSNGKPQVINIDVFTVPAIYAYYTAPKYDPAAFLLAKVSDFEQYEMLPGEANLFLSNTYVGKTYLDPSVFGDTLELSLGRDQSITVKREKIKEFSNSKRIGNATKETIGIEISVRNTKNTSIDLVIEDQIPISTDKEIEVSLQESTKAKLKNASGKLKWTRSIPANSSDKVKFIYDVKYPSDKKINL